MKTRPRRPLRLRWGVAVFAFALAVAALRVGVFTELGGVRLGARWAMVDFNSGAYYPVRAVLAGENPYDRARFRSLYPVSDGFPPYPPLTLLIHLPFGLLPHATAVAAYAVFTVCLMLLFSRVALDATGRDFTLAAVFMLAGLLLLSRPGHWNLVLGQRAVLLALGSYVALFHASSAPWLSALGLTIAMLKPTWGVPLALLMLARGDRAAVRDGVLVTAALNVPLLAVIVQRAGGLSVFMARVMSGYREWQTVSDVSPATSSVRIDIATSVSRFLGHPLGDGSQIVLTGLVVLVAAATVHFDKDDHSRTGHQVMLGVICTGVLLCGHHVGYDFLLLTVPALLLVFDGLPGGARPLARSLFLSLYAITALNWLATDSFLKALRPTRPVWLFIASLNGVALIVLFSGYVWLAIRIRRDGLRADAAAYPAPVDGELGSSPMPS